ncbi:MAG TPA: 30S ribosomal protein S7 [bacterium]|nr:30S ribosomal protein S7 [bacterium]
MPKKKIKQVISPDSLYESVLVAKFINKVMERGKKTIAQKIVWGAFKEIKDKIKKDPLEVFDLALRNAAPLLEVKSRRVGGANYQVPIPVKGDRRISLAMRWIIEAAKSKKGKAMKNRLAEELIEASKDTGAAVKKKENMHRMAEANRAFAHFARSR